MATPLTDKINALTAYANEITGESDTTLSEAVHTLADGYGQGGGDTIWPAIVDRTVTEINDEDGLCEKVGAYAFRTCMQLTSAIFPSATSVAENAFYLCSKLSFVDLPSASKIDDYAFYACRALKALILRKSDAICKLSSTSAFSSTAIKSGTGYIYVPSALIETYKTAYQWKDFAAQFRALEDYTVDGTITGDLDPNKI
jgi:hypothetical protein